MLSYVEFERKLGLARFRGREHDFANGIREPDGYRQAIIVQAGIELILVRPITSRKMAPNSPRRLSLRMS